ncbi:MAG: DUF4124 domain-containing protein [Woeseiaceae bacterium]|nr:DUF4124 domain-containing protein [Woeseiaceae bacterium]
MKLLVLTLAALLAIGTAAHAEVYKWVDEDGNVHFTDTPPPKQKTEEVKIDGASRSSRIATSTRDPGNQATAANDRALCAKAVNNLSRFSSVWERKIRAKMPSMAPDEKANAERALRELKANIKEARKDMSQCTNDLDNGDNRAAAECMANAPNADAAMFCVL